MGNASSGAVSNASVHYNFNCANLALALLGAAAPPWALASAVGSVFLGCMCGMAVMGYLGDALGRARSLLCTLSLLSAGALASALLPHRHLSDPAFFRAVAACRFLVGFGAGGVYPLTASAEFEAAPPPLQDGKVPTREDFQNKQAAYRTAVVFCWQSPGFALPYLAGMAISKHVGQRFQWRAMFALGAALPLTVFPALARAAGREEAARAAGVAHDGADAAGPRGSGGGATSVWRKLIFTLRHEPTHQRHLAACALCWFLYDVYVYGIALYVVSCFVLLLLITRLAPQVHAAAPRGHLRGVREYLRRVLADVRGLPREPPRQPAHRARPGAA